MPIPKDKQDLYGKVIGKNINEGKSRKAAKEIAERAVKPHRNKTAKQKGKG